MSRRWVMPTRYTRKARFSIHPKNQEECNLGVYRKEQNIMIKPNARNSLIVLMLFIITFSAGCAAGEKRNYLTVREALEQAKSLK